MFRVIKGMVMESIKFLKSLNVMYVEDDYEIALKMKCIFDKIFNIVIPASNGEEGVEKFIHCKENDIHIDVIISDINMPKLSGLDMIKSIRKLDDEVPFILTTAYSNSEYLLEALNFGVSHYAVKPINLKELIRHVEDVCETKYKLKIIESKNNELLEYLHIIDQVAIVSRVDLEGKYIFVNDIFCHISGYNKNEVLGKEKNFIKHKDMPSEVYEESWDTVQNGQKWSGKLKNCHKNGNEYFTKTTVLPFYDLNTAMISEYIEISFPITVEENEKREFRKKVIHNIQETKRQNHVARKMIDELKGKLDKYKHIDLLEEAIVTERKKTKQFKKQNDYYETLLSVVNVDKELKNIETKNEVKNMIGELAKSKYKNERYHIQVNEFKKELDNRISLCETLSNRVRQQSVLIKQLQEKVEHSA